MLRVSSALIVTLVTRSALACPALPLVEEPVTPTGATIYDTGGVLMSARPGGSGGQAAMPSGPQLRSGGTDVEMEAEYVAPALSLLRPKQVLERTLELVDAQGTVLRSYEQRAGGKPLGPPNGSAVSTLTRAAAVKARPPYPPQGTMTITLAQDPPADAAVLVVQTMRDRTGIAWAPVAAGQRTFAFEPAGKGCTPGPATARQGARIVLVWFDIHGQRSAASTVITVGAARR
jgi:hypothetical protein